MRGRDDHPIGENQVVATRPENRMVLFATDRDRLVFLLEIDAALDPDFEAIEALAGREDGILTHPTSVKYNRIRK